MTVLPFTATGQDGAGDTEQPTADSTEDKPRQESQATRALEICADLDLCHTPEGDPYFRQGDPPLVVLARCGPLQ
jgi:hypothetical protein